MLAIGQQDAVNILRFFDDLPDPRSKVNRLHRLGDVIAICAIMATADGPTAIAKWAKLNGFWLRRHLALPNGIPGKDTFRRVLGLLPPAVFQQCFQQWLETLQVSPDEDSESQKHIAIDGKTLRRSHDRKHGLGPMHIVSAWASDHGISLGQVATDEKSNEITAIPQLLDLIDVEDAVVTIDAAGCQKAIAAKIVDGKGDYVLALKGNQEKLFEDVQFVMLCHMQDDCVGSPVSRHVEVEQGHGPLKRARTIKLRLRHTFADVQNGKDSRQSARPSASTKRMGLKSATPDTSLAACGTTASNSRRPCPFAGRRMQVLVGACSVGEQSWDSCSRRAGNRAIGV